MRPLLISLPLPLCVSLSLSFSLPLWILIDFYPFCPHLQVTNRRQRKFLLSLSYPAWIEKRDAQILDVKHEIQNQEEKTRLCLLDHKHKTKCCTNFSQKRFFPAATALIHISAEQASKKETERERERDMFACLPSFK